MRLHERRTVMYCSFCFPARKVETAYQCGLCGDEICRDHRYTVGTPDRQLPTKLTPVGAQAIPDIGTGSLASVCPNCAGESINTVARILAQRGGWS